MKPALRDVRRKILRMLQQLVGTTQTIERPPEYVDALVDSMTSKDSIGAMMSFGQTLLKNNLERVAAIDAKATALVGYSTAILAFLLIRSPTLGGAPFVEVLPMVLATLFGIAGCWFSALTLRAARNWKAVGEATWFPELLHIAADSESLNRYYLKAMHESHQTNQRITNTKAGELIRAQLSVASAGICIGLGLLVKGLVLLFGTL